MIRALLLVLAGVEVLWYVQGGGAGNLIAAVCNVGAAASLDFLNTAWRRRVA